MPPPRQKPPLFTRRESLLLGASAFCLLLAGAFLYVGFHLQPRRVGGVTLLNGPGVLRIYWLASDEIRKMNVPRSGDLDTYWVRPEALPWKPVWFARGIRRELHLPITAIFILLSIFPATFAFLRRRKRLKAISPSQLSRICPGCSYEFPAQQPRCPECGVAAKSEEATAISE